MAGKKDRLLTQIAKNVIDQIQEQTELNIKQIMSASILAFNDLPMDKKHEYVTKSLMGDFGGANVKYVLLSAEEKAAVDAIRRSHGPDADTESAAEIEAAEIVDAAEADAAVHRKKSRQKKTKPA